MTPYLQGQVSPAAAIVSAVNADPAQFPPMLDAVGGDEIFHDAVVRFVDRVSWAGGRTVLFDEPGTFHVYMVLMSWMEGSRRLYDNVARRFATYWAGQPIDDQLIDRD